MTLKLRRKSQHRKRIATAQSKISNQSPVLDVRRFLNTNKLKDDVDNFKRTRRLNNELMVRLNAIQRIGGRLNTFEGCHASKFTQSRVPILIRQYRDMEAENVKLGTRLLQKAPEVECWMDERKLRQPLHKITAAKFEVPVNILAKYSKLKLPHAAVLKKLMRPLVFLDFYIKDLRPVGRVVIKLYTEACPQVVLALVRACRNGQPNDIVVRRLFPTLWMDFELTLAGGQHITANKIEYDKRALDYTRPGVLHFSRQIQHQLSAGVFFFSMSSKPLPMLYGKRVAFGRVTTGLRVIECMQSYGMKKSGKLSRNIIISKLGVLP